MRDMPQVPLGRPATYNDLVALPDHVVAEIAGGELWASPRPAPRHALALSSLTGLLVNGFQHGRGGPGGWLILVEPELHLTDDVLVPDLAGWRQGRMSGLPETPYFTLAPDWVCEILSPSTAALDRTRKLWIYAREGVRHHCIVDPGAHTLEVLALDAGRWVVLDNFAGDATAQVPPFEAVPLELGLLWERAGGGGGGAGTESRTCASNPL
jgi:Uma2 family endonuclease